MKSIGFPSVRRGLVFPSFRLVSLVALLILGGLTITQACLQHSARAVPPIDILRYDRDEKEPRPLPLLIGFLVALLVFYSGFRIWRFAPQARKYRPFILFQQFRC